MTHRRAFRIAGTVLAGFLTIPFPGLGQESARPNSNQHARYKLVDLGTLGGPDSEIQGNAVAINPRGDVAGDATTSVFDPDCGCYHTHAFEWHEGVMTDLGTLPGGSNSTGVAINGQGAVVGFSENGLIDPVYGLPAFVTTRWKDGEIDDLGTFGGGFSLPNAINGRGQIAGFAGNTEPDPDGFATLLLFDVALPGNQWHAALWQDGAIRDLGTLADGLTSAAFQLNERGQVAGVSFVDTIPTLFGYPTVHPFLWENGHMTDLGTLGGVWASANGLNNRGEVVGATTITGDETNHAYLWSHGTLQDLGTLGGTQSTAWAINDSTEIVGEALILDNAEVHAFLWKRGRMADLGTVADCQGSIADSINAKGQVVGESFDCGVNSHAFLWEDGGPAIDLNTFVPPGSDLDLTEALFVSDRGEIAGRALLPNGDSHAFLLIPGGDGDDLAGFASSAIRTDAAAVGESAARATRVMQAPDPKAAMRARLAPRHRGPASLRRNPAR
jgi:probable HAF family extracellular repeat protein